MDTKFLLREYTKSGVRRILRRFDLGVIRGPFDMQVYRTVTWLEIDEVLDVGANVGQYAAALFASGFKGQVTSCEPLASAYGELQRRAARRPNWRAINTAAGAREGVATIHVAANSYSSSILEVNQAHLAADRNSRTVGDQEVAMTTVDTLLKKYDIVPSVALLKVDTQGYEASVLDGAPSSLSSFAAVQLEVSFAALYDGQALFEALDSRMSSAGFQLFALGPGISDRATGQMLQADALYVSLDRIASAGSRNSP